MSNQYAKFDVAKLKTKAKGIVDAADWIGLKDDSSVNLARHYLVLMDYVELMVDGEGSDADVYQAMARAAYRGDPLFRGKM